MKIPAHRPPVIFIRKRGSAWRWVCVSTHCTAPPYEDHGSLSCHTSAVEAAGNHARTFHPTQHLPHDLNP